MIIYQLVMLDKLFLLIGNFCNIRSLEAIDFTVKIIYLGIKFSYLLFSRQIHFQLSLSCKILILIFFNFRCQSLYLIRTMVDEIFQSIRLFGHFENLLLRILLQNKKIQEIRILYQHPIITFMFKDFQRITFMTITDFI